VLEPNEVKEFRQPLPGIGLPQIHIFGVFGALIARPGRIVPAKAGLHQAERNTENGATYLGSTVLLPATRDRRHILCRRL
jgi:hypothetical protein